MVKRLFRLIIFGATILSKAFSQALRNESSLNKIGNLRDIRNNPKENFYSSKMFAGLNLEEAKQILDLKSLDSKTVENRFDYLFKINDKYNGGSFYLQSKIYRAKQRIDLENEN